MSQENNAEPFRTLDYEYLLQSPWRNLRADRLDIGNGREIKYTYLEVPKAVYVVPLTPDGQIALIRQYRYPIRNWELEITAGSVEEGENLLLAAKRELYEEVGGECEEMLHIGSFNNCAAHTNLSSEVFLATGVKLGEQHLEETELVELILLPVREVLDLAHSGGIKDGQSAYSILLAEPHILTRETEQWLKS